MKNIILKPFFTLCFMVLIFVSCTGKKEKKPAGTAEPQAISLLGQSLYSARPSVKLFERYQKHKIAYEKDPENNENVIWFGRFIAYKGDYKEAIAFYTKAIEKKANDPRLYRHRGHRYITTRQFDLAIKDFEYAATLIKDEANQIEADGMPNARNIPVSTLHGNIWYHLGLAYYLKHDLKNALRAYQRCLATGNNSDNVVSSSHWLYMILRRLEKKEEADKYLQPITKDMDVIENMDYHRICLFYKGELALEELTYQNQADQASDAVHYAIGNWYFYNGDREKAREVFKKILARKSWGSFGYIAAEAQYAKEFAKK